ncbi:MAG: glycoside hydrolase family 13 protein [Clostridia bacterium]|nr:glycoside hydrolase family 13 protein [Clostridia bacterium]
MRFDSHIGFFREPLGPAAAGATLQLRFICDDATHIVVRTFQTDERAFPMREGAHHIWEAVLDVPEKTGLLWYDFIVYHKDGTVSRYGAPEDGLGGEGRVWPDHMHAYQLTIYDPHYTTPRYMHGAVIYQIFPDRFYKAPTKAKDTRRDREIHRMWTEDLYTGRDRTSQENDVLEFYGGTLNGIREKLPYLKDLGVDILYLNPIFQASSNHRYDTADYSRIDPLLGTEEDLTELCRAAEGLGMRVMLDGVFSHTGEDSLYFNHFGHFPTVGAFQGPASPYYDWYTFEHYPDKYRAWWGIETLPEVRKDNPEYQEFMFNGKDGIVPRWIRAGACGWRLDVADELPMSFLRKLRDSAKRCDPDAVVLGEVWEDASNKVAYGEMRCYCTGDTLDSVMNYPLRTAILDFATGKSDAKSLVRLINHQSEVYPPQFQYALMNLLGSHDRVRVLNMLVEAEGKDMTKYEQRHLRLSDDDYALARERYLMCLDLLCALPGCPTIYYGDEAGLTGTADPFCRRPFPWGREDRKLQQAVRAKLQARQQDSLLRYGHMSVEALDDDTVRIQRYFDGHADALGRKNHEKRSSTFVISRKRERNA